MARGPTVVINGDHRCTGRAITDPSVAPEIVDAPWTERVELPRKSAAANTNASPSADVLIDVDMTERIGTLPFAPRRHAHPNHRTCPAATFSARRNR